jgi:hypothetical protein
MPDVLLKTLILDKVLQHRQNKTKQLNSRRGASLRHISAHDSREVLGAMIGLSGVDVLPEPHDVEQIRQTPTDFVVRNVILGVMARRIGELKQTMGELVLEKKGKSTGYYTNQEHIEEVITKREESVKSLAALACEACPLQYSCGIGPTELASALMPKNTRRRFRSRIRGAHVKNTHYCATNLKPSRLRKAVA